jgi:tRNA(Arg) A34 adenosine deaminase TadA
MRRALELAWEAFRAGSLPVGAVLTDAAGMIVAEGRNRIGEGDAPPGRMHGTGLAHAEVDVLAQVPPADYGAHALYTSLEPRLLCRAALVMDTSARSTTLPPTRSAARLEGIASLNDHSARWYPRMHQSASGLEARFAGVLPLAVVMLFSRDETVLAHYRRHSPDDVAVAQQIIDEDLWPPNGSISTGRYARSHPSWHPRGDRGHGVRVADRSPARGKAAVNIRTPTTI